ncbi:MAG TPA: aminomethyltransferase family protein [Methylomirabilota bacterium]|nr:aminomethyltransferase family protein [Methylomirabilota bacterium]
MPNQLALESEHRGRGAVLRERGGWLVPTDYGDVAAEYRALVEATGLVDRSMLGKVVVTGRDRQSFLQGMLSNDVKALAPAQGTPAAFLDAHGKVIALLSVYALEDRVLLELPPSLTEKTLQALDKFLISEKAVFEAADEAFAVLAVQGPGSRALLERLAGRLPDLAPYHHLETQIAGAPVRVINRAEGHAPGFHCWTLAAHGAALWRALVEAGARPVGVEALDVLRVEGGVPWYGPDVDESVILPETRLEQLVSYTKGCYIGQEVVARVKYRGHINRGLCGLVLEDDRVPPSGAAVVAEGKEVGRITSAVRSIALDKPIALGYVRREHFAPGSAVGVQTGDALIPARVAELPFVRLAQESP